jgi:hypothetical protein
VKSCKTIVELSHCKAIFNVVHRLKNSEPEPKAEPESKAEPEPNTLYINNVPQVLQ